MAPTWQELAANKKQEQEQSIPKEWRIQLPPESQLNVLDVPTTCGLLTPKELEITGYKDVTVLLDKLATGQLSAVEVTTAFCKRAIIAHQVVSQYHLY